MKIESYRDLIVWQKGMDLVVVLYRLTDTFPKAELYGLVSQIRRCVVSIVSNIAEGRRRGSRLDYRHFLIIAFGSGSELETQIEIARRLHFGDQDLYAEIDGLLDEVMRMLNSMINSLQPTS